MRPKRYGRMVAVLGALAVAGVVAIPRAPAQVASSLPAVRILSEFGDLATPQQAQAAFDAGMAALTAEGGGVLVIPATAVAGWIPANTGQTSWREPEPPAPAKRWGTGPGVTVLDYRAGTARVEVPGLTGLDIVRVLKMPPGSSSPHWEMHPAVNVINSVLRGTTSYREPLIEDVPPGIDRRFYVNTIRGVFPGMFLNSGDGGKVMRLYVKDLGFDREKRKPYFTADADIPVGKGSLVHNKTHANALKVDTYAHTENQTFDIQAWRRMYTQGDTYLFDARFDYMSDVHSTGGDENGVLYAAMVRGISDIFRGTVAAWDPDKRALTYTAAANANTLGSGRPIINLNSNKWITAGHCSIGGPGGATLGWGGSIYSTNAPWTADLVGRYFAVDEADEYVPKSAAVRRWWYISAIKEENGVKRMSIQRHWWGAKDVASITKLYNPANFTWNDKEPKPLKYIIAPGANAYDVSDGVPPDPGAGGGGSSNLLCLSPGPHVGTAFDFAPGDPIEQAIGPDPFRPVPFRSWLMENVPGAWPAPVFDIANHGEVSRYSVMTVGGGSSDAEKDREERGDRQPPWENYFFFNSSTRSGIVFAADTTGAAIDFQQPHGRPQALQWRYKNGNGFTTSRLTVEPDDGTLTYSSPAGMAVPGGVKRLTGLSGTATASRNLRGVGIAVAAGATRQDVRFREPEADAKYAVFVEQSWIGNRAVVDKTAGGFAVEFDPPAPQGATLDWMIVR